MINVHDELTKCTLCKDRFADTHTGHKPRPIVWFSQNAPILIAGQAPGLRVHESGVPFDDRSGDRLREWLGVDRAEFYDQAKFSIVPMAFCFPGYNAAGHDLAPPKVCAQTWRSRVMDHIGTPKVTILIGKYAQDWHLKTKEKVHDRLLNWRDRAPDTFVVPHPSWRNNSWLKKNPWFEQELLPVMRASIRQWIDK